MLQINFTTVAQKEQIIYTKYRGINFFEWLFPFFVHKKLIKALSEEYDIPEKELFIMTNTRALYERP